MALHHVRGACEHAVRAARQLGATARALGAPPLADLEVAALEVLGKKADAKAIHDALEEGWSWQT